MNNTTLLRVFRSVYFVITGIIVIPLATFFASGGIGENYSGTEFPAPAYLWLIAIWIIGLILHFKKLWLGVIIAIIPVIYFGVLFINAGFS
ncbi:hypothetical protein [Ornithinibacillus scapharcae]|uniref:hypothetical protein n=1 Tax=Ornithinibacillus scapharcae TaxID=1147159 RepID=UPI000225BD68|nr:hypothetical protein [Ornithinibacillus scapharcae]